ncbi:imidazole glycerol phosphate synthase subunit HisF [Aestuariispira insulae]|uniref:Imidazole glycerol phosphate synthase subunit HisF n=1 Tax=Aestuariispira insulae TaxID=1461337 RepID=A0A3D9H5Q9_9PROT|nr:imidazole glycerol phosphate synthase cyclase subunit [Aestuariispira insulae]RED44296.1 cyclase [Aestuariispira insulae]
MKKNRLIPVLLLKDGYIVQSKLFAKHQDLGNPVTSVQRLSAWASDELIYLDISRGGKYRSDRDDKKQRGLNTPLEVLEEISKVCFMPLTFGGRIRSLQDIEDRLKRGADKISINTQALREPEFITQAAKEFGSQCIVVSIDVKKVDGDHVVMTGYGQETTSLKPLDWAKQVESLGAGEILLNSIDHDGMRMGYDLPVLDLVSTNVQVPVIALGGVGDWWDFGDALDETNVDAVAAANIFHYYDQSVHVAKKYLHDNGYNVRPPDLISA